MPAATLLAVSHCLEGPACNLVITKLFWKANPRSGCGRGKELSDAESLQEALGAPACFCHPHHPWERGTNENTNGLLRDWFPKGESLDDVSDSEVQEACDPLSRRPRKRLRWKCSWEVCHRQSLHLL